MQPRQVAVTIDDLPVVRGKDLKTRRAITSALINALKLHQIPAIGFVNEQKLGEPNPLSEEVALLSAWLDAGLELGNHTFSHPSLFRTPLEEFKREVQRGAIVTRRLLSSRGQKLKFFRHPFLNTGPDRETKIAFEEFLRGEGYAVAPVTIDNSDWLFSAAYEAALARGDATLASSVGEEYLAYMTQVFEFYEQFSRDSLGREPSQILLLHANKLNADYLQALIIMIKQRGYRFISLEESLRDRAYTSLDEYTGKNGISWLQRWWITKGNSMREEPAVPEWIVSVSGYQSGM